MREMTDDVIALELAHLNKTITDVQVDISKMSQSYLRVDLYEAQRTDHGRRVGDIEKDVSDLRKDVSTLVSAIADMKTTFEQKQAETRAEADKRFRANTMMAIGLMVTFLSQMVLSIAKFLIGGTL